MKGFYYLFPISDVFNFDNTSYCYILGMYNVFGPDVLHVYMFLLLQYSDS